jgi:hypothetical protein
MELLKVWEEGEKGRERGKRRGRNRLAPSKWLEVREGSEEREGEREEGMGRRGEGRRGGRRMDEGGGGRRKEGRILLTKGNR